jgi:hypothetical protein
MNRIKILIIIDNKEVEYGYLLKQMPQGDGTNLYEAIGETGKFYILKEDEFFDMGWIV